MPYSKTTWKDRAVEHPRTYTMVDNGDGTITLVPAPGTVYEQGTPVNAANLNKIEQGIADATATAEAALPKAGGTLIGDIVFNNAKGVYGKDSGGTTRRVALLSDAVRIGDGNVPLRFHSSGKPLLNDSEELITSAGGQTFNASMTISSKLPALRLFDTDSNNSVWLLHDNNAFYLQLRDASGNWIRDIMRLTDDGLTRKLGNDDIWHTGMLRNNSGVLELYHGGVWTPVGGIKSVQRGSTSTYTDNSDPENPVPVLQIDVPISAVNTNKAFVIITSTYARDGGGGFASNYQAHAQLLNSTTVRINATVTDVTIHWQVVESY